MDNMTQMLLGHVLDSLARGQVLQSKLPPEVLTIHGWTGNRIRHFLNNLGGLPGVNYLEVGTFNGATITAAAYGNTGQFTTVDIDDATPALDANKKSLGDKINIDFVQGDCWNVDIKRIPAGVNVYFFDGPHEKEDHAKALPYYLPWLADQFIFVVDDWEDEKKVRAGTFEGIKSSGLLPAFVAEIGLGEHEAGDGWWNSLGVFVLRKL